MKIAKREDPVWRQIYASEIGPIPDKHDIHHIDNNKVNNNTENLIAIPRKLHMWLHKQRYFYFEAARYGYINKQLIMNIIFNYENKNLDINKLKFPDVFLKYLSDNQPNLKVRCTINKTILSSDSKKITEIAAKHSKMYHQLFCDNLIDKMNNEQVLKILKNALKDLDKIYQEAKQSTSRP
jgi:hypothetical protein